MKKKTDEAERPQWGPYTGNHKQLQFTGNAGPQINLNPEMTPLEAFQLFMSEDLFQLIVTETNRYAESVIRNMPNISRSSRMSKWTDTNLEEMGRFFGITIWMGLCKRSILAKYWSTDPLYKNMVSKTMSRNRFEIILRMLHFSDNSLAKSNDRQAKIRPLLFVLEQNFQSVYTLGPEIVIDETMVPWRGRLLFKQYIPGKKHKYGVKLFKICNPKGFTWKIQIYSGKSGDENRQTGLGERVVMYLCEGLLDEGRTLYTDNFYTSVTLAQSLLKRNTHLVGTLRKNRKNLPKTVLSKTLELGATYGEESQEGIVVQKWKPKHNKEVVMLSTKHSLEMQEVNGKRKAVDQPGPSKRARHDDPAKQIMKPKSVIDYNNGKAGIDKSDQMSSYNTALRKGMKWYRKVALELITGTAVVNAHVIYKDSTNKKVSITQFREEICKPLIFRRNIEEEPVIKEKVHLLLSDEKRRNCSKCYISLKKKFNRAEARKKVRRVKTYCSGCPGKTVMCKECHTRIHSK